MTSAMGGGGGGGGVPLRQTRVLISCVIVTVIRGAGDGGPNNPKNFADVICTSSASTTYNMPLRKYSMQLVFADWAGNSVHLRYPVHAMTASTCSQLVCKARPS